jgi:hypothetical protein
MNLVLRFARDSSLTLFEVGLFQQIDSRELSFESIPEATNPKSQRFPLLARRACIERATAKRANLQVPCWAMACNSNCRLGSSLIWLGRGGEVRRGSPAKGLEWLAC